MSGLARAVRGAALWVGVLLGACKPDEPKHETLAFSATASQSAATAPSSATAAPPSSLAAFVAPSSVADAASADASVSQSGCKRLKPGTNEPMCNLGKDYCCENVATGEAKCVPHAEAKGLTCSDDGAWRVAIGCSTSSMCGPAQKCCIEEPVPGFLQTVCAASCDHEEVCVPNLPGGECRDKSSFDCVASPASRTGARCLLTGTTGGNAAGEGGDAECRRTGATSCGRGMVCIEQEVSRWLPDGSNRYLCVKKR